ncbi:unnamed protein product [Rhizophagus irregularis]|nr:unnamed protein product [Rhizophagus irregularis]
MIKNSLALIRFSNIWFFLLCIGVIVRSFKIFDSLLSKINFAPCNDQTFLNKKFITKKNLCIRQKSRNCRQNDTRLDETRFSDLSIIFFYR